MLLFWPTTNCKRNVFPSLSFVAKGYSFSVFRGKGDIEKEWAKFYAEVSRIVNVSQYYDLTHNSPVLLLYTPWKKQHLAVMG